MAYYKAEGLEKKNSIYLVVIGEDKNDAQINELKMINEQDKQTGDAPLLLFIDIRKKPSASKRK